MTTKNHGTPMTPSGKGATKGPMLVAGAALLIPAILLSAALGGQAESTIQQVGGVIELPGKDRAISPKVEEVFKVGALQGEDWEMFGQISWVAFGPEGNLYVLDGQAKRIVVLGPDGTFLRTFGREGKGPGELASPSGLAVLADGSIVVYDFGNQGLTLFSSEGSISARPRQPRPTSGRVSLPRKILPHPRGGVVSLAMSLGVRIGEDGKISAESDDEGVPVVFYPARKGGAPRILHRAWRPPLEDPDIETTSSGSGGRTQSISLVMSPLKAFEPDQYLGVLRDGRMVLSDSSAYIVKVLSPEGKVVRRLRRPLKPTPVTKKIQEKEKARRMEEMASGGGAYGTASTVMTRMETTAGSAGSGTGGGGGRIGMPPEMKKMMEERLERLEFADVIPIVTDLAADWEGRIWVERAGKEVGEEGPIDLITADGKYLGTISPKGLRIPNAFGPGGLMAYITADRFDVPVVVVKRLKGVGG